MAKRKVQSKTDFLLAKGLQFAKDLRKKATKWELHFLTLLSNTGVDFVFQHPVICNDKRLFIIDFYIPSLALAIELDGSGHYTPDGLKADKRRTALLRKEGIQVLRFQNSIVYSLTSKHIQDLLQKYV